MSERLRLSGLSMRYRVLFVFFIVTILPFLLVGYIAWSKAEKTIRSTNLDAVVLTGKNLNYYFQYVQHEQDKLMASDEMQALMSRLGRPGQDDIAFANELLSYVDSVNYANRLFELRVLPLDPADAPTYMRSVYGQLNVASQPWFADIVTGGRSRWKLFEPSEMPGAIPEPTFSSVKRLHSLKTYEALGVVVMDIRPAILADFIDPVKQFPNQTLMLVGKDGRIVYTTSGDYAEKLEPELVLAISRSGSSDTVKHEGRNSLVNVAPLLGDELKLVSVTPVADLGNPVAVLNRLNYTFLLFYFLLSITLAGYITVKYSNPVTALTRQMKGIVRSGFDESAIVESRFADRRDEIGWLYRGMYNMIREIKSLLAETKAFEKRKKQLEFEVLNYQINPHFLYNTLDTIRWKAEAGETKEVGEMASSLATLFRLTLNRGQEMTTVRREMELLRSYLNIEKARQGGPVYVTFSVEEELMDLPLMRLILQPLLENAIRHGVADKGEDGIILVQGAREDGMIVFRITDNGPGMPDDVRRSLLEAGASAPAGRDGGLGLRNVHERLRLYFGEPYGLEVDSEQGRGTTVVLLHPVLNIDRAETEA